MINRIFKSLENMFEFRINLGYFIFFSYQETKVILLSFKCLKCFGFIKGVLQDSFS